MRITRLAEKTIPLRSSIRNAWIDFSEMTCSVVSITTDLRRGGRQVVGYGFNSNGRYGQPGLLRERFMPRLLAATEKDLLDPETGKLEPSRVHEVLMANEKPGGHGERSVAVGVLDMAIWDIAAKIEDIPLAVLLARRHDRLAAPRVPVYAAGGYYDRGKGLQALRAELEGYLARGFTEIKIKIGGVEIAQDLERIDLAIEVAGAPSRVAVDANGRLDLDSALAYARAIESLGLKWYEEPVDPLDYASLSAVAAVFRPPLATGENLFSVQDVRNLLRYGGLRSASDFLQMDPVLGYGLVEYERMLAAIDEFGWDRSQCVPHGGHLLNLHIAAGLGLGAIEVYPSVFEPFGGLGDDVSFESGVVDVGDAPGLGLERNSALFEILKALG